MKFRNFFLKYNKKLVISAIFAVDIVSMVIILFSKLTAISYVFVLSIFVFCTMFLLFIYANLKMKKMIYKQLEPFAPLSGIRNVDILYIGEFSKMDRASSSSVCIYIPRATEEAAFEVLKHTFSILNETESTVVLCLNDFASNSFNIFAIPFFSEITINRLHLKRIQSQLRFPLVHNFTDCMRFLLKKNADIQEVICNNQKIIEFCNERHISIKYFVKKV